MELLNKFYDVMFSGFWAFMGSWILLSFVFKVVKWILSPISLLYKRILFGKSYIEETKKQKEEILNKIKALFN